MKVQLGHFHDKVSREDIFKPTIRNESLHEVSNDNGVRLVNFATPEKLRIKSTIVTVQIFGDYSDKSKFDSKGN
jgi:hypothetical protein